MQHRKRTHPYSRGQNYGLGGRSLENYCLLAQDRWEHFVATDWFSMFTVYYWLPVAKNAFQVCQYFATFCALLLECQNIFKRLFSLIMFWSERLLSWIKSDKILLRWESVWNNKDLEFHNLVFSKLDGIQNLPKIIPVYFQILYLRLVTTVGIVARFDRDHRVTPAGVSSNLCTT